MQTKDKLFLPCSSLFLPLRLVGALQGPSMVLSTILGFMLPRLQPSWGLKECKMGIQNENAIGFPLCIGTSTTCLGFLLAKTL